MSQCITVLVLGIVIFGFKGKKRQKSNVQYNRNRWIIYLLFYSELSTSAPTLESCRYRCRPVRGTLPVMTAYLPEILSAAGTGGRAWKSRHVHRGEGTHTCSQLQRGGKHTEWLTVFHVYLYSIFGRKQTRFWLRLILLHCFIIDPESIVP